MSEQPTEQPTYTVTKEQFDYLMAFANKKAASLEKKRLATKRYHQSEKGKIAKRRAQAKYRAKKKLQASL